MSVERATVRRSPTERMADVRKGIRAGLRLAVGLGEIATVVLIVSAVRVGKENPIIAWLVVVVFYAVAEFLAVLCSGCFVHCEIDTWDEY